jgi:hypothetical protein
MMAVSVSPGPEPMFSKPRVLFEQRYAATQCPSRPYEILSALGPGGMNGELAP